VSFLRKDTAGQRSTKIPSSCLRLRESIIVRCVGCSRRAWVQPWEPRAASQAGWPSCMHASAGCRPLERPSFIATLVSWSLMHASHLRECSRLYAPERTVPKALLLPSDLQVVMESDGRSRRSSRVSFPEQVGTAALCPAGLDKRGLCPSFIGAWGGGNSWIRLNYCSV
jgi:hypothetical protein